MTQKSAAMTKMQPLRTSTGVDIISYIDSVGNQNVVAATRDSRELSKIVSRRAIIVTHVRDPADAKRLRITADFIIYEITPKTTERELRRIIDNKLCDMLLGAEQLFTQPGLHFQKILFNQVIATICAQQHIVVLLSVRPLLFDHADSTVGSSVALRRALVASRIRFISELCEKYDAPHLAVTFATNELESRNPVDLQSILETLLRPPHLLSR